MKFSSTYFKRANETSIPKVPPVNSAKKDNAKEKAKKQKNIQSLFHYLFF